jgi:hypothetical protein
MKGEILSNPNERTNDMSHTKSSKVAYLVGIVDTAHVGLKGGIADVRERAGVAQKVNQQVQNRGGTLAELVCLERVFVSREPKKLTPKSHCPLDQGSRLNVGIFHHKYKLPSLLVSYKRWKIIKSTT